MLLNLRVHFILIIRFFPLLLKLFSFFQIKQVFLCNYDEFFKITFTFLGRWKEYPKGQSFNLVFNSFQVIQELGFPLKELCSTFSHFPPPKSLQKTTTITMEKLHTKDPRANNRKFFFSFSLFAVIMRMPLFVNGNPNPTHNANTQNQTVKGVDFPF